jgi:hypothetical protein
VGTGVYLVTRGEKGGGGGGGATPQEHSINILNLAILVI